MSTPITSQPEPLRRERRDARRLAFEALFELESRPGAALEGVLPRRHEGLREETGEALSPAALAFVRRLVRGTLSDRPGLDACIHRTAPAFPVDQLPMTDRIALEMALYELLDVRDTPIKVVINEAVELAKLYGGENSGRFVNGVLGTVAESLTDAHSPTAGPPARD